MANRKYLILFFFLLNIVHVTSQTPYWEWARSGKGNGVGYSIAIDGTRNIYVTGGFTDGIYFGPYLLVDFNGIIPSLFLTKYDSLGNVIWARSSGGTAGAYGTGVSTDNFGYIYLTGHFSSGNITFGTHTLTNAGDEDMFIVKYDSLGNVIWANGYGGSAWELPGAIATDNFGGVFLTGFFASPSLILGNDTLMNVGYGDEFLIKLNSSGNVLWSTSSGGDAEGKGLATDNFGNAYVTGNFSSSNSLVFGNDTLIASGSSDYFLVKYDSSGNVLWALVEGGDSLETRAYSVATNDFGKVFITGYYHSPQLIIGTDTLVNSGPGFEAFIASYDSSGNAVWARGSGVGQAKSFWVTTDHEGNAYITGRLIFNPLSFDTITLTLSGVGYDDMFLIKYDSTGNAIFGLGLEDGDGDHSCIVVDSSENIYFGSDFTSNPFILGNDTLTLYQSSSPFVAKLSFQFGVGLSDINMGTACILFPNPFDQIINVKFDNYERSEIKIFDLTSRLILQQTFSTSASINTEQFESGIYFYEVEDNHGTLCKGLIVKIMN